MALAGLPERIDQVARSTVSPPLEVHPLVVPGEGVPGQGYVVVRVPPSPEAPHMVDGRYWGRGALTKEPLSDAQVREVFDRRSRARADANQLLAAVVDRDPTPPWLRTQAHLFVLAHPLFAPPSRSRRRGPRAPIQYGTAGSLRPHLRGSCALRRMEPTYGRREPTVSSVAHRGLVHVGMDVSKDSI